MKKIVNKKKRKKKFTYSKDDTVHLASIQNEPILKRNFPNINFVHDIIDKSTRKRVVGIFLNDSTDSKIPAKLPVHLPDGTNHIVNTILIKGLGQAKAHFANNPTAPLSLSSSTGYTGSACCILQDLSDNTKNYILTSCHVLTEEDLINPLYDTNNEEVTYDGIVVGNWLFGSISSFGDYATALLKDNFDIENSGLTFSKGTRDVNETTDINITFHIKSQFNDGTKNVYFHGLAHNKVSIGYSLGHSLVFDIIMLLNDSPLITTGKTLTKGGDSGGAVYDAQNFLVGIIVGGDEKFSYAIPVKKLIDGLKLKTI